MTTAAANIGIGLWTMQSTAVAPANPSSLYRSFADAAVLVEELGFHSIWTAEHHAWYDGWCPALIEAQAFAAARTTRLRFGNAMLLLPQHDPLRLARSVATLDRLSGGRVDLGAGLGHRDSEFDLVGLRRDRRGRLMEHALETLEAVWRGERGDEPVADGRLPRIFIGGMAPAAIARAARLGHPLMLPPSLTPEQLREIAAQYREQAAEPAQVACMRDVWVEPDRRRATEFADKLSRHYREEAGSWWVIKGDTGFRQPEQLDRQLRRASQSAMIGGAEDVAAGLNELVDAGANFLVLRLNFDFVSPEELAAGLLRLTEDVVPLLDASLGGSS